MPSCALRRLRGAVVVLALPLPLPAAAQAPDPVLGDPVDVGLDFLRADPAYFMATRVARVDAATGAGTLVWERHVRQPSLNFAKLDAN